MKRSVKVNINDVEKLVKASQLGERDAFDELVRLYQRRAMEVAVRILGDVEAGSEVVQQGFVTAYLKINKLRDAKRFKVWLLRIVTNTAFSQLRAAKRGREKIRVADCYADKAASPTEEGIAEELEEAIKRAMLELTRKEAKAISLFGLEDLSQREVAQIMGCSVEAVRWYVFRARQKLKVLLKEYL